MLIRASGTVGSPTERVISASKPSLLYQPSAGRRHSRVARSRTSIAAFDAAVGSSLALDGSATSAHVWWETRELKFCVMSPEAELDLQVFPVTSPVRIGGGPVT